MAANRITPGGAARRALAVSRPRGQGRRALAAAGLAVALTLFVGACGSAGDTTTAVPDKAADVEILNTVLAREQAAVGAYDRVLPRLRGPALAAARRFRAQEQEHTDAVVKALRGLGGEVEPKQEEIEANGLGSRAGALAFLYELESVSVADGLRAVSNLSAAWPRALLGSIVANQAQHLVLLRRALGVGGDELVPRAFEDGTIPAPSPATPAR